jgi:hypothetical protein
MEQSSLQKEGVILCQKCFIGLTARVNVIEPFR